MRSLSIFLTGALSVAIAHVSGAGLPRTHASGVQSVTPASSSKPADKAPADCGCEARSSPDVLATVNEFPIGIKYINDRINDRLQELQKRVIDARNRELNLQINTRLLDAEAKRLGTASEALLAKEIMSKMKEPTEAQ